MDSRLSSEGAGTTCGLACRRTFEFNNVTVRILDVERWPDALTAEILGQRTEWADVLPQQVFEDYLLIERFNPQADMIHVSATRTGRSPAYQAKLPRHVNQVDHRRTCA